MRVFCVYLSCVRVRQHSLSPFLPFPFTFVLYRIYFRSSFDLPRCPIPRQSIISSRASVRGGCVMPVPGHTGPSTGLIASGPQLGYSSPKEDVWVRSTRPHEIPPLATDNLLENTDGILS